jgi:hypothetical protein
MGPLPFTLSFIVVSCPAVLCCIVLCCAVVLRCVVLWCCVLWRVVACYGALRVVCFVLLLGTPRIGCPNSTKRTNTALFFDKLVRGNNPVVNQSLIGLSLSAFHIVSLSQMQKTKDILTTELVCLRVLAVLLCLVVETGGRQGGLEGVVQNRYVL